jgi:hypothetical protein
MDETGRAFFEQQVERATERYHSALDRVKAALDAFNLAKKDAETMQLALAVYTRDSRKPYEPPRLSSVTLTEDTSPPRKMNRARMSVSQNRHKVVSGRKGRELDFSMNSKAGILRNVLKTLPDEITIDDMFAAVPFDSPLTITKGDLFRMLPRFVSRGELEKHGRIYRKAQRFEGKGLFSEV